MEYVVLTGDRKWARPERVLRAIEGHPDAVWVIGDCPSGLDVMAWSMLTALGCPHLRFLADWDQHGKAAGPIRNQEMVKSAAFMAGAAGCAVSCLGFHGDIDSSRGTKNCMQTAKKAGIDTFLIRR